MIAPDVLKGLQQDGFESDFDDEPIRCVSLYVGRQSNGEPRFLATVADFGDGLHWELTRLDRWGGTGSRAAWKRGTILLFMYDVIAGVDRRDGTHRMTLSESRVGS